METFRTPDEYRPVVVINPASMRADRVQHEVIEVLERSAWGKPAVIETASADPADNALDIAEQIEPGNIVLACGGDGLTHSVANAAAHHIQSGVESDMWIVPLPTGNACDISRSVFAGRDILADGSLPDVLSRGRTAMYDAVGLELNGRCSLAMAYAGIGLTGELAALYANETYRNRRPAAGWAADWHDIRATYDTLRASLPFHYRVEGTDGERQANEIICANMPRIAKLGKVAVGLESGSIVREFPAEGFKLASARAIGQLLGGGLRGQELERFQLTISDVRRPVAYHADGEVGVLEYGDTVAFTAEPDAIPVIGAVKRGR